jgi:DNA invertase Pin-like site-specific DNA recombinase
MEKAVGYIRVSTEDQARTGVSLDSQRAKLIAYADLYGIELVSIEADEGVSAKSLDRPALARALAIIDKGQAGGLLIAKLDRLSRSVSDWDKLIKGYFGEKAGKQLMSVGDSIDTRTAAGRLVLNVLMSVAQWEREKIAEGVRDGLQFKIRTGSKCSPKVRYGHSIDPDDPRRSKKLRLPVGLAVAPAEAEAIELMVKLKGHGLSLRAIAETLTSRGIPTREGRDHWDHSSVRKILKRAR